MFTEEVEQLNLRVEQAQQKYDLLVSELRAVEAELQSFSADRQRFDALRDACNALDKLKELKSDELFWGGIPESQEIAGSMERSKSRLADFEGEISGVLEQEASLHRQIDQCLDELDFLEDEIRNAYGREERRQEEYVIEREISSVPYREMIMPWTREAESEKRYRRYLSLALLLCFFLSSSIALIKLPALKTPPLVAPPERLVSLLKPEPPKPAKVRKRETKQAREVPDQAKKAPKPKPDTVEPEMPPEQTVEEGGGSEAREKDETAGVLNFKAAFKDLMKET